MHTLCDGSPSHLELRVAETLDIFNRDADPKIRRKAHQCLTSYWRKGKWNIMWSSRQPCDPSFWRHAQPWRSTLAQGEVERDASLLSTKWLIMTSRLSSTFCTGSGTLCKSPVNHMTHYDVTPVLDILYWKWNIMQVSCQPHDSWWRHACPWRCVLAQGKVKHHVNLLSPTRLTVNILSTIGISYDVMPVPDLLYYSGALESGHHLNQGKKSVEITGL